MNKVSSAQAGQMTKLAASALRAFSEENHSLKAENQDLKTKVAHFERKEHAEKIASMMEDKGLNPELSYEEKVASILKRDDLRVLEEAVSMSTPQMKIAGINDNEVVVEGGVHGQAEASFAAGLATD